MYYTESSRKSASIIEIQSKNVINKDQNSIEAMHYLKKQSVLMKEAILRGEIDKVGEILDFGWKYKKQMAKGITNQLLDEIYDAAIKSGATGGKVSGAGGGGFMSFYCPNTHRYKVETALKAFGGQIKRYEFIQEGLKTWTIQ